MNRAPRLIWTLKDQMQLHGQQRRVEVTVSLLQPRRSDVILDVGCGDGFQMHSIVQYALYVVGIDVSCNKLREGKKRVRGADFICANSEMLPFQPQVFHKVMCLELLEHLRKPSDTLNGIDLVLKSGGTLIVSVPYNERIVIMKCIYCGKHTPLWGHLHSFNENKLSSLFRRNYRLFKTKRICTQVSLYLLFSFLPTRIWKIVDYISRLLPGIKPSWLIIKVKKVNLYEVP